MSIRYVNVHELDAVWPVASGMIKSALDTGQGEMNEHQARYAIAKGLADLFICENNGKITGAVLVEFQNYPNYRLANVIATGGRDLVKEWDSFKGLLRLAGASYVEGHCHDSVARLWESKLKMKKVYTIMRGDL